MFWKVRSLSPRHGSNWIIYIFMIPKLKTLQILCFQQDVTFVSRPSVVIILVKNTWNEFNSWIAPANNRFLDKLRSWNKVILGNIFQRKDRKLIGEFQDIKNVLQFPPNNFIISLKNNHQLELSHILDQEEKLQATKSLTKWVRDGDKNRKFYHNSSLAKKKEIRFWSLKNLLGIGFFNGNVIQVKFQNYFSNLSTTAKVTTCFLVICPNTCILVYLITKFAA